MTTASEKPIGNMADTRILALIPCAGQGSRAGKDGLKQYRQMLDEPVVMHTIAAFRAVPELYAVWVIISGDDAEFARACPGFGFESYGANEVLSRAGGATRAATVLNGLKAMLSGNAAGEGAARPQDWVLVHDAARCLITPGQIMALIEACRHDAVGGLLAQQLPDTLKSGIAGRVSGTVDRNDKYLAQTPQMFRIGALINALEAAGDAITDESSAMEAAGLQPKLVPGNAQNFKVTYPEDFALAEAVLGSRKVPA